MKRIVLWFLGTASAVALMFGYHTSTSGPQAVIPQTSTPQAGGEGAASVPTAAPSSAGGSSTVTGDVAQTQWGPVQVQLTLQSGKITAVSVPQYPNGNRRDGEINDYALPILINETVQAQSADIDMVSGATVTSDGYIRSLQSALDQAK
ncbi:FMN-binding protein [Kribbella sp. NPDC051586]|uniref:FMN-binding protein n=1 Tax=Kribbella sp. NPDC051586 TaxID=3364118 RepID=UPI00378E7302